MNTPSTAPGLRLIDLLTTERTALLARWEQRITGDDALRTGFRRRSPMLQAYAGRLLDAVVKAITEGSVTPQPPVPPLDAPRGGLRASAAGLREILHLRCAVLAHVVETDARIEPAENLALHAVLDTAMCHMATAVEHSAAAAIRARDEFVATASHELRTPLTAILGWTHMLRARRREPAEIDRALAVIERNGRAQAQLIEDLLDASRIAAGKLRLELGPTDLTVLVRSAIDTVRPTAEARRIELRVDAPETPVIIQGDGDRLQQVVLNLLGNAIKFTPAGGTVTVELSHSGANASLKVTDTGAGIDPMFLPHLFEPFAQGDGSSTRSHGGLGLGLAIVRAIVEGHGGAIAAVSSGSGRGATFNVLLPTEGVVAGDRASVVPSITAPTATLTGANVLLVEPDDDTREVLALVLRDAGAEVYTAASTSEALVLFESRHPDVIVSAMAPALATMPPLLDRVRSLSQERGGQTPAMALTASAAPDATRAALRAGYDGAVSKPVDPYLLVDGVRQLLEAP